MALSPLAEANATYAFAGRLVRDLVDAGVAHVAVCAGSRSAPLAAVAATTSGVDLSTHVDERSAGFFALGFARARRAPVALVCTSGTAAANFAPAVAEADRAGVPLIVLSADRPPELRDRGAPQTIDQVRLFGSHVRWFHEPPPPDELDGSRLLQLVRLARALSERALAEATGHRPGPVHLNLPFREPLDPQGAPVPALPMEPLRPTTRQSATDPVAVAALRDALGSAARPALVVGPWDPEPEAASRLADWARRQAIPVLAEPLAGLRAGAPAQVAPLISSADALLRSGAFAGAKAPDLVIRVGAPPTSKAIHRWLASHPARVFAFDAQRARRDPDLRVDQWIDAEPEALAHAGEEPGDARDAAWLPAWQDADKRAWDAIRSVGSRRATSRGQGLLPPAVLEAVADGLEQDTLVYLANSLAVRDVETFLPPLQKRVRFLGNRGANGIDGTLSSALGAAASGSRVVLLTGDLALLHDAGAWLTARRLGLPLTVVAFNDGGGGIFDHLPIASRAETVQFEQVFRLCHDQPLAPIAEAFGCRGIVAASPDDVARAVARPDGPTLVEVRIDPAANLALHREAWRAVEGAVASGVAP